VASARWIDQVLSAAAPGVGPRPRRGTMPLGETRYAVDSRACWGGKFTAGTKQVEFAVEAEANVMATARETARTQTPAP
jgi:hypothetical protein